MLERGVMAELDEKPEPELFRQAFKRFEDSLAAMDDLDKKMGELIAIHKQGKSLKAYDLALARILKEMGPVERVGMKGLRYSNVPNESKTRGKKLTTLLDIMEVQREDLAILREQLRVTIEAFRAVIPLADKNEFSAMMLSGRLGFADKILQQVNLITVYSKFYTRTCLTSIDATMQVYPAGLQWLKDSQIKKGN